MRLTLKFKLCYDTIMNRLDIGLVMKRAVVNFSNGFNYDDFKDYSKKNKISLSRALLKLAQESLTRWKDEQIADSAVKREEESTKKDYLDFDSFWDNLNV